MFRRASDTPAIVEQLVKAGAPLNCINRLSINWSRSLIDSEVIKVTSESKNLVK